MRIIICWQAGFKSTYGNVCGHSFMEVKELTVGSIGECCRNILDGIRKEHPDKSFQDNLVLTSVTRLDG